MFGGLNVRIPTLDLLELAGETQPVPVSSQRFLREDKGYGKKEREEQEVGLQFQLLVHLRGDQDDKVGRRVSEPHPTRGVAGQSQGVPGGVKTED